MSRICLATVLAVAGIWAATVEAAPPRTPADVDALMAQRTIAQQRLNSADVTPAEVTQAVEELAKLAAEIDAAANARYSHLSGLFWYTDLEQALKASREQGKPILSLRLLGKLTEELSCANSRFFRTILYPNEQVKTLLHERFILHWESIRPAPVITIDFGDGRKIERTITGNSIHYILAPDGEVVDALPGMYAPQRFLQCLNEAEKAIAATRELSAQERTKRLETYRSDIAARLHREWEADLKLWAKTPQHPAVEEALLSSLAVGTAPAIISEDTFWTQLGSTHPELGKIDDVTRTTVLAFKTPAAVAGRLAMTKARIEIPGMRMVRNLEESLAIDTLRNEYQFRPAILNWLQTQAGLRRSLASLNQRVYAQLFLTPQEDPWLGLALPDVYSAIPNGGLVQPVSQSAGDATARTPVITVDPLINLRNRLEAIVPQRDNAKQANSQQSLPNQR